jgi:hypothetical protein
MLAPPESQAITIERFRRIGSSLDMARYGDAQFVAERLHGMTAGRSRIELPEARIGDVTVALRSVQAGVRGDAEAVVRDVRRRIVRPPFLSSAPGAFDEGKTTF